MEKEHKDTAPELAPKKRTLPEALRKNIWKKGQSGNPGGRSKKLSNALEQFLDTRVPRDPKKRKYAELLIQEMVKRAIKKSDPLIREIFERVEGHVPSDPAQAEQFGVKVIVVDIPRPPRIAIDVTPPVTGGNGKPPSDDND